jgi:hypothetical protein
MCPSSDVLISLRLVLQIATLAPLQKKFTHLKSQLELKTYDLSLFEGRAEQSEHHKVSMPLPDRFAVARIAVNLVLENHGLNSDTKSFYLVSLHNRTSCAMCKQRTKPWKWSIPAGT